MSPRTGRPKSENPKTNKVETRLSNDELEILDFCCKELGKSRPCVLREGMLNTYKKLSKSKK